MKGWGCLLITAFIVLQGLDARSQAINDHIFPAATTARPYIDFDSKGFLIRGKRTFIVSAGIEYARVPHQLWYDRLLRIKRAGFNCVEIYTIWNFHEAQEGTFDFSGDRDLGAFLALVDKLGLYAIVRVGPYYCAEWDYGGYPLWLKFKKGVRVREHNKLFERYVDRFFDKLLPIVFSNQISKGGSVILVQLENEHIKGWGTVMPDRYFTHLRAKALSLGLQVPYFFCGLHHASDPAGDEKLDDAARPNPWFSTEFWSVWYSQYGAKPNDAALYDRRTWKIIAHGGNGYNYYMVHGGSNFGYTNNDEDAASYDYGAAIGQAGDLRPIYYTFKRAAWFARSFQEVLENSADAGNYFNNILTDTALKISARTSKAGDILFIDNPGSTPVKTQLNIPGEILTIAPGELYPLVHNLNINQGIRLDWAFTRIFAITQQQNTTTIITDAEAGARLSLHFSVKSGADILKGKPDLKLNGNRVDLRCDMPAGDSPVEYSFKSGKYTVRILAMTRQMTDNTWIADKDGKNYIISGAAYMSELSVNNKQVTVKTEQPLTGATPASAILYTDSKTIQLKKILSPQDAQPQTIPLSKWLYKTDPGATVSTAGWLHSPQPQQMGADGDVTADAWYRTTIEVPEAGNYTLQVNGNGRGQAYVDGEPAARWNLNDGEVALSLKKGSHSLAIFTAHDGRDKLASYMGAIENVDNKGIFGDAAIKKGGPFISTLNDWYFVKAANKKAVAAGPPQSDTSVYKSYKIGADAFNLKEGYGWFQTVISKLPPGLTKLMISFKSVDENATVFINGKQVSHNEGWNVPFKVTVTDQDILKGPVVLSLFIENYSNEGGIDQPVTINTIGVAIPVTGWALKGGPGKAGNTGEWLPLAKNSSFSKGPSYYKTSFIIPESKGEILIWRFDPKNMGHGSVWVNGHNLGRYPEKIAVTGLYIPECWLKGGMNELVIYDEDGKRPDASAIIAEPAAGRVVNKFKANIN